MDTKPNEKWLELSRADLTEKVKNLFHYINRHKSQFNVLEVMAIKGFVKDCCDKKILFEKELGLDEDKMFLIAASVAETDKDRLFFRYAGDLKKRILFKSFNSLELKKDEVDKIIYLKTFLKFEHLQLPEKSPVLLTKGEYNKLLTKLPDNVL